ncbi:DUF3891 family protein [Niallia sp. JL1B1071]|uniref:DUF3891 family protein n=1 Tax=Niallia tiangongensis TaxID=3237105 RepID=UPI0037DC825E
MIISQQKENLVLVRQDEHMAHAGELAKHWGNERVGKPTPNESVVKAIGFHDVGWGVSDDQLLFNEKEGKPLNFIDVDLKQHVAFYGQGFNSVLEEDPYAGLLIGMHWIGLYTSRFGYDPTFTYETSDALRPFMNETIVEQQKAWVDIKETMWNGLESRRDFEDKIWMHYEIFQVIDRLSLFICLNDLSETGSVKLGPVRFTQEGKQQYLNVQSLGNGRIKVDPFPFDREFSISVPALKIPNISYENREHFKEVYQSTQKEMITCTLVAK